MQSDRGTPRSEPEWSEHPLAGTFTQTDTDAFRQLSGQSAKGVGVASTRHRGYDSAATVTDYLAVSFDPPTMLVSLDSLSQIAEAVQGSGRWGLSLLSSSQISVADQLSGSGRPLIGQLAQVPTFRREENGVPLIIGSLAWFELRTIAVHEAATHSLFIGEVTAMGSSAGPATRPLMRFRSAYTRL